MENKFLCLMAMFDDNTNEKFEIIKKQLECNRIESYTLPPHITLAAYVDVNEEDLCEWIDLNCINREALEVNFSHIGLFSLNVLFLAPQVSESLSELHKNLHMKYEESCGEIGYKYTVKSNSWIPHATILINEPDVIVKALPVINENFQPFVGKITSLRLCEFYPMREIRTYNLKC